MTPWAGQRLDIPMIAVEGKNHCSLISEPDEAMVKFVADFLKIGDAGAETHDAWLDRAKAWGEAGKQKMLIDPGKAAGGVTGEFKTFFGHLTHMAGQPMEGWQQFIVRARDERGDPVTDYIVDVLRQEDGNGCRSPRCIPTCMPGRPIPASAASICGFRKVSAVGSFPCEFASPPRPVRH
jgi:hypothetical protein